MKFFGKSRKGYENVEAGGGVCPRWVPYRIPIRVPPYNCPGFNRLPAPGDDLEYGRLVGSFLSSDRYKPICARFSRTPGPGSYSYV